MCSSQKLNGFELGLSARVQWCQDHDLNTKRYHCLLSFIHSLPCPKTCHPNARHRRTWTMLPPHARSHTASHQRRIVADAVMLLHGPRGAASTGNIKVAFCRSFSVRRHKAQASRSLRKFGLPCAGRSHACRYLEISSSAGSLGRPIPLRNLR